ncbi:hypothetical protein KIN20_003245 [Parelaphostrongylus tenuis]|uniref:Uncharacterized protein n=1 Tax=Parelaphostrongylus tenuis TaxID=148309 RepID=A0AAD5MI23_PARTN|nr:hypothetical protein KIN20_003245 [Parelaphostrongylus tenuis]
MVKVIDVLEQQGRNAGLPDAIISGILGQLMVQIGYDPLECKGLTVNPPTDMDIDANMLPHCLVVGSTVTALCATEMMKNCMINTNMRIAAIPTNHTSIAETITV